MDGLTQAPSIALSWYAFSISFYEKTLETFVPSQHTWCLDHEHSASLAAKPPLHRQRTVGCAGALLTCLCLRNGVKRNSAAKWCVSLLPSNCRKCLSISDSFIEASLCILFAPCLQHLLRWIVQFHQRLVAKNVFSVSLVSFLKILEVTEVDWSWHISK